MYVDVNSDNSLSQKYYRDENFQDFLKRNSYLKVIVMQKSCYFALKSETYRIFLRGDTKESVNLPFFQDCVFLGDTTF